MPTEIAPPQDLRMALVQPHPDQWAHISPCTITPLPEDLKKPSQRVTVFNSSEAQTHIVRDRQEQGHELKPRERKEMELRCDTILYFLRERDPDRYDNKGKQKPMHPIIIEGISEQAITKAVEDWKISERARVEQEEHQKEMRLAAQVSDNLFNRLSAAQPERRK